MAELSQIELNGTTYDLKDATSRGLLNGHSVNSDVPANAEFTDTTYGLATTTTSGLMSATDKTTVDGLKNLAFLEYEEVT